ncbi:hypothetical protein KSP40_PGU016914 [Platanthera guangdongensis]|uniref:40S ribosomal protein S3a n=1 Tax=Platanthera guangdongensis TaxID=2320717 RepID=A0ABR2MUF3_9ASPA
MDFTTDKLRSLVRKWQTLIEAHVDVKTTDNYSLRMFCIAFTKRMPNQVKRACYAQSSQIRQIRRKMREIMINQASSCDLKELVLKFIPEVIGKEIEKATTSIYPLQNVFIRKVKILKAPKFDLGKLMEERFLLPAVPGATSASPPPPSSPFPATARSRRSDSFFPLCL